MRSISLCFSRLWSIFGYRNDADRCIAVLRVGSKRGQSHSVRCVGLVPRLLHCYLMDASRRSAEAEAVLSTDYVNHPVKSLFHSDVFGMRTTSVRTADQLL